jgi:PAS domain S-box-containing protein
MTASPWQGSCLAVAAPAGTPADIAPGSGTIDLEALLAQSWSVEHAALAILSIMVVVLAAVVLILLSGRYRQKTEEELHESEERWRTVVENVPDFILLIDREFRIVFINHLRPGYKSEEVLGSKVLDYLGDDYRGPYQEHLERVFQRGEFASLEMIGRGKPGEWSWYITRMAPVRKAGEIVYALLIATDISERKKTEEQTLASLHEKEALLKEIHHRVKNNLQIVSSLLNLQADELNDPNLTRAFTETRHRVRSMALLHETLYQSENLARIDLPCYLASLCQQLFRSYGTDTEHVALQLEVREKHLDLDRAIPCGLIINELVSNALKYAFPGQRRGTIRVEVSRDDSSYHVVVGDDGVGLPGALDWRKASTLGLRLVRDLAQQLNGAIELEPAAGAVFRMRFNL